MSSIQRFRYADSKRMRSYPKIASVLIEIGDMCYWDAGNATIQPASAQGDQGTEAQNQDAFCDLFVGVAMEAGKVGEVKDIEVATRGVFEFECAAAQFAPGAAVAPPGATTLDNQKVVAKAGTSGVGIVAKRYASNTTRVLVDILTAYDAVKTP